MGVRRKSRWIQRAALGAAAGLGLLLAAPAMAATYYLPVQYQFGRYGELYYGGAAAGLARAPVATTTGTRTLTVVLADGVAVRATPPALARLSETLGLVEPGYHLTDLHAGYLNPIRPQIYSDLDPWSEVGQYGFTIDDARNEAYFNVPLYQTKHGTTRPHAAPSADHVGGPVGATKELDHPSNHDKAIPLLDWAQHLHQTNENPKLLQAVLAQARRLDPNAVSKLQSGWQTK